MKTPRTDNDWIAEFQRVLGEEWRGIDKERFLELWQEGTGQQQRNAYNAWEVLVRISSDEVDRILEGWRRGDFSRAYTEAMLAPYVLEEHRFKPYSLPARYGEEEETMLVSPSELEVLLGAEPIAE